MCNIEVLADHVVGVVGELCHVFKGQKFVGVYDFETNCGSFTCCSIEGNPIYFDADKVVVTDESTKE